MEYEICTETLVKYALRDTKGDYLSFREGRGMFLGGLASAVTYDTVQTASNMSEKYSSMFNTKFTVRKVKTIDIGEYVTRKNEE